MPAREDDPLAYRRNWGRWGENDERGAVNLITPRKRVEAAGTREEWALGVVRPITPAGSAIYSVQ